MLFDDDSGHERVVEFLGAPFGMAGREVERRRVRLDVLDVAGVPIGATSDVRGAASDVGRRVRGLALALGAALDVAGRAGW